MATVASMAGLLAARYCGSAGLVTVRDTCLPSALLGRFSGKANAPLPLIAV